MLFPLVAAGLGLEPRFHAPEARVLPLDDPAALYTKNIGNFLAVLGTG